LDSLDNISYDMDRPTEHSSASSEPLDHLRTNIPSGGLAHDAHDIHESDLHYAGTSEKAPAGDEEDDEDIDALIAELESEDGEADEEEEAQPGMSARPIPEELLNTDTRKGLTQAEVAERRRRYGLNQMAEEKENLIKKFLMYFVGPIQFVMEVCLTIYVFTDLSRLPLFLQPVFKIG
jgi:H+-transporting ATPase